jgi:hypothetical protein
VVTGSGYFWISRESLFWGEQDMIPKSTRNDAYWKYFAILPILSVILEDFRHVHQTLIGRLFDVCSVFDIN